MNTAYFDYAATTPTDERVVKEMLPFFGPTGVFGNASSVNHMYGTRAAEAVELARKRVARLIEARPSEIIWTSGATEANNLAIRGALKSGAKNVRRLITVATEHSAVLDTAKTMRKKGIEVEILPVRRSGLLDLDRLERSLSKGKALVSVMWVNNETGVVQPLVEVAQLCRKHGALLHTDAAQAIGKTQVSVKKIPADLISLSAHKAYGPKGVGALFVRSRTSISPIMSGGGQEKSLRPGTLPVPLIVGMGKAFEILVKELKGSVKQAHAKRDFLVACIRGLGDCRINGDEAETVPNILNVSFGGLGGQILPTMKRIAVSSGSACATGKTILSHVLIGMGVSRGLAANSIRISFGRYTTASEMEIAEREIQRGVDLLRKPKK